VVPEPILDADRQKEEENAEENEANQVFAHQVPAEWALKHVFTYNSNNDAIHNSRRHFNKYNTTTIHANDTRKIISKCNIIKCH